MRCELQRAPEYIESNSIKKASRLRLFVEIRLFPDLEATESTMYLATRKTLSQHTAPSGEARAKILTFRTI